MNLKLVKTNKRHAANELFVYYVSLPSNYSIIERLYEFDNMRKWCWEQWGPGCERDVYIMLESLKINNGWAWHLNHPDYRIYFDSEEKSSWFLMRWG